MTKVTGNTYHYAAVFRWLGFKWNVEQQAWIADAPIADHDLNRLRAIRGIAINGVQQTSPKATKADAKLKAQLDKLRAENEKLKSGLVAQKIIETDVAV